MRRILILGVIGVLGLASAVAGAGVATARKPPRSTTTTSSTTTSSTTSTTTSTSTTTTTTTTIPNGTGGVPTVGGCNVFPADNPWNTDITNAPLNANSSAYISNILANGGANLHADFGGGGAYGIPYITVG